MASNIRKQRYQIVPIRITAANQIVGINVETDNAYDKIKSIQAEVLNSAALTGGAFSTPFTVNDQVVFDTGFEMKLLYSTLNVPAKDRSFPLNNVSAKGAKVQFQFQDNGGFVANGNAPYTINLYLHLVNEVEAK